MNALTLTPSAAPIEARQLEPLIRLWLDEIAQADGLAASTPQSYRYQIRPFVLWWRRNGRRHEYQLSRETLAAFDRWLRHDYRQQSGRPLSAASRAVCVRRMRQFFGWAYDRGYAPQPVGRWLPRQSAKPESPPVGRHMTPADLIAMLRAAGRSNYPIRDVALLALLAGTGARRSEIHAARVENITWHTDGSGALYLAQTKLGKPRSVLFGPVAGRALQRHLAEAGRQQGRIFEEIEQSDGLRQIIRRTAQRANTKCTAHSFRRLFSAYWYANHPTDNRAAFMLRLLLGHAGRDVTEEHYLLLHGEDTRPLYVSPIETEAAAAVIEEIETRLA